jgi:hypothetical protein
MASEQVAAKIPHGGALTNIADRDAMPVIYGPGNRAYVLPARR